MPYHERRERRHERLALKSLAWLRNCGCFYLYRRGNDSKERPEDKSKIESKTDEGKKDTRETRKDSDRTRTTKHSKAIRNRSRSRDNDSEQEDSRYICRMAGNLSRPLCKGVMAYPTPYVAIVETFLFF